MYWYDYHNQGKSSITKCSQCEASFSKGNSEKRTSTSILAAINKNDCIVWVSYRWQISAQSTSYLAIKVDLNKLAKSTAIVISDCLGISKGFQQRICWRKKTKQNQTSACNHLNEDKLKCTEVILVYGNELTLQDLYVHMHAQNNYNIHRQWQGVCVWRGGGEMWISVNYSYLLSTEIWNAGLRCSENCKMNPPPTHQKKKDLMCLLHYILFI